MPADTRINCAEGGINAQGRISPPAPGRTAVLPVIAALVVLSALVADNLYTSLQKNDGLLIYPLDDAYIHMAIAKNLAAHGVWGVTRYGFTSSSSSVIWTALLGIIYLVAGVNSYAPIILNALAAVGVVLLSWVVIREELTPFETSAALIAVVILTPMPAMVFSGMEHSLHILLSIAFLFAAGDALESPEGGSYKRALLLAPLLVGTRYEGLFLVFVACCLFFIRRQVKKALLLGLISLVPVVLFGLYSLYEGWSFLPNSLLLKGGISMHSLGMHNFKDAPHVTVLLALAIAPVFFLRRRDASRERTLIFLFAGATLLHMVFASVGWFFRYEAYIIAMGILVFALSFKKAVREKLSRPLAAIALALAILLCRPLFYRGCYAFDKTPVASGNIYRQQYQTGLFLAKYFSGRTVAAIDIGAISYLADVRELDLFGLGNREVAKARSAGVCDASKLGELSASCGVDLAIVYDEVSWVCNDKVYWLGHGASIPTGWEGVATWKIPDNVVCVSDAVRFYAVNPKIKTQLVKALEEFSPTLPTGCRTGFINHTL